MTENPRTPILRQARHRTTIIALGAVTTTAALTGVVAYQALTATVAGEVPSIQYFGSSDDDSGSGDVGTQPGSGIQPGTSSGSSHGGSHSS